MYTLYIGNKNYSSWSLRPWVLMRSFDIAFEEVRITLNEPDTAARIRARSPSGRVPVLHDGATVVWDSLAIAEYLAERHPGMWPADPVTRAWARSVCAEMHSGFSAVRNEMTMCIRDRVDVRPWSPALERDVARVIEIWNEGRRRFARAGPYLCGEFSVADAFYAPVAFRFRTYGVDPDAAAGDYLRALLAHPFLRQWEEAALKETAIIEADEPRIIYRDKIAAQGRTSA